MHTLRRVSGQVPWTAYTIAFVELCERFSYYGTTAVFVNFIQQPRPEHSKTGAGFSGQSGALGMGQRASTGLTTCRLLYFISPGYRLFPTQLLTPSYSQHLLVLFNAHSGCLDG